jgi:hypothetical protein
MWLKFSSYFEGSVNLCIVFRYMKDYIKLGDWYEMLYKQNFKHHLSLYPLLSSLSTTTMLGGYTILYRYAQRVLITVQRIRK